MDTNWKAMPVTINLLTDTWNVKILIHVYHICLIEFGVIFLHINILKFEAMFIIRIKFWIIISKNMINYIHSTIMEYFKKDAK